MDIGTRKVFEALCARAKAKGADAGMTRAELESATGLSEKELMATLRLLHPPGAGQDAQVRFNGGDSDKIALGFEWRSKCEDNLGRKLA